MNTQQALEYSMQPFIPMFIFGGGYEMVESERLRSEEALKALVDEWNANPEPSFGYDVIMGLADSNRELCDHVGETRLRNRPPSMQLLTTPRRTTAACLRCTARLAFRSPRSTISLGTTSTGKHLSARTRRFKSRFSSS